MFDYPLFKVNHQWDGFRIFLNIGWVPGFSSGKISIMAEANIVERDDILKLKDRRSASVQ